eukprot:TRINITY_DN8078_c0_g1_i2.p1 TRINITY_DN8078_c0_g1~~TRINITY_DN8078_c0_g1_i2.p1  ORF type:complete len:468 (+),score=72.48 TRINITY_DN8078_c0_g1_i2:188-1591(+)
MSALTEYVERRKRQLMGRLAAYRVHSLDHVMSDAGVYHFSLQCERATYYAPAFPLGLRNGCYYCFHANQPVDMSALHFEGRKEVVRGKHDHGQYSVIFRKGPPEDLLRDGVTFACWVRFDGPQYAGASPSPAHAHADERSEYDTTAYSRQRACQLFSYNSTLTPAATLSFLLLPGGTLLLLVRIVHEDGSAHTIELPSGPILLAATDRDYLDLLASRLSYTVAAGEWSHVGFSARTLSEHSADTKMQSEYCIYLNGHLLASVKSPHALPCLRHTEYERWELCGDLDLVSRFSATSTLLPDIFSRHTPATSKSGFLESEPGAFYRWLECRRAVFLSMLTLHSEALTPEGMHELTRSAIFFWHPSVHRILDPTIRGEIETLAMVHTLQLGNVPPFALLSTELLMTVFDFVVALAGDRAFGYDYEAKAAENREATARFLAERKRLASSGRQPHRHPGHPGYPGQRTCVMC